MNRFSIVRLPTLADASARVAEDPEHRRIRAGGIDLLDLMKEGLEAPEELVELAAIGGEEGTKMRGVVATDDGWRVGALVTLGQLAEMDDLPGGYQALRQAAGIAATPGIRNAATVAGNLLQRPRCWYYRHADMVCLKKGGDMCYAQTGDHRYHAILGGGPSYIVHPSSIASPLLALDAKIEIWDGKSTTRTIGIAELFTLPTKNPTREHTLAPGEIVLAIHVPAAGEQDKSVYATAKEKQSQDWPLAEATVRATMSGGKMTKVAVALGHVAPIPWNATEAAAVLEGQAPTPALFESAAKAALSKAKPLSGNAYKVPLTQGLVRQALHELTGTPLPA
ncbi:MAG: FAD binding domain-containing protein [Myxococcota bacterium]